MKKWAIFLGLSLCCLALLSGMLACGDSTSGDPLLDESTSSTVLADPHLPNKVAEGQWILLRAVGQLPQARAFASMVYDPNEQRIIVFGGGTDRTDYGDTWAYELDSGRWTALGSDGESPSARELAPMVYDEAGEKIYLFGGWNEQDEEDLGDTWCFDPKADVWSRIETTGDSPSGRDGHSMVYDPVGKRIVLFGGSDQEGAEHNDTWAFDPATHVWTEIEVSGDRPVARGWHGMAYDSGQHRVLIFGGAYGEEDSATYLNDTWAFDLDSNTWEELQPSGDLPGKRYMAAMAYDPGSALVFLYGGGTLDGAARDMWAYDAATDTWIELQLRTLPGAALGHAMILDTDTEQLLLFGGIDTYSWDATKEVWAFRPPGDLVGGEDSAVGAPSPRTGARCVYDPVGRQVILFGGERFSDDDAVPTVDFHDTWAFDLVTTEWRDLKPQGDLPPSRSDYAMAYDPVGKHVILFGGSTETTGYGDTWSYDPEVNEWTELRIDGESPSPRAGHVMVYDTASQSMIMFGGSDAFVELGDTWSYDPAANTWTELHPKGDAPEARMYHIMFHDGERVFLLGGSWTQGEDDVDADLSKVWAYDSQENTWTMVDAVGPAPTPRFIPAAAYDEGAKQLVFFGGADSGSFADLADTWRYDPAEGSWFEYVPEDTVPMGREDQAMVYDPVDDKILMFGGMRYNIDGPDFEFLNDIWQYDCSSNYWLEITPAVSSGVRALLTILHLS